MFCKLNKMGHREILWSTDENLSFIRHCLQYYQVAGQGFWKVGGQIKTDEEEIVPGVTTARVHITKENIATMEGSTGGLQEVPCTDWRR